MIASASLSDFQPLLEYLKVVPYNVSRTTLYTATELYDGYDPEKPDTYDTCHDQLV